MLAAGVSVTPRSVHSGEVSQSNLLLLVVFRLCSSSPPSLISCSFPPVRFRFVTPLLDSARLQGCLAAPLKAHDLLSERRVTFVSVETVAARKRQVRTVHVGMRATDDTHNQASNELTEENKANLSSTCWAPRTRSLFPHWQWRGWARVRLDALLNEDLMRITRIPSLMEAFLGSHFYGHCSSAHIGHGGCLTVVIRNH